MKGNCILEYLNCDTIPNLDIPDFQKKKDGVPVGCGAIRCWDEPGRVKVTRLFVVPNMRSRSISSATSR